MRLGTRLMLALAYVLVLAIVALEIPLALSLRERVDDEVRVQATNSARMTAAIAEELVEHDQQASLGAVADAAAQATRGRAVIVDADGIVLADSARGAAVGSDYSTRPEVRSALNGHEVQYTRGSTTLGQRLLATATPIENRVRTIGAVRITQSIAAQQRAINRAFAGLALIGIAVLLVGLAVGALIARQIARPLRSFEAAARSVEEGDFSARAPVTGSAEQKALAEAFNDMAARVQETLQSQQQFVADASHQLRTPLAGLRLRLEEARAGGGSAPVKRELDHGIAEVDRLSKMVNELLVLSGADQAAAAQPLVASAIAEDLVARWRNYSDAADRELTLSRDGADFVVVAARGDVERALEALLENALHYSPEGTQVNVIYGDGTFAVEDAGPGLAGEDPEALFTRFHRGRAGRQGVKGTGLGLAIARETVRRWHGDVTLDQRPSGGMRARIDFTHYEPNYKHAGETTEGADDE